MSMKGVLLKGKRRIIQPKRIEKKEKKFDMLYSLIGTQGFASINPLYDVPRIILEGMKEIEEIDIYLIKERGYSNARHFLTGKKEKDDIIYEIRNTMKKNIRIRGAFNQLLFEEKLGLFIDSKENKGYTFNMKPGDYKITEVDVSAEDIEKRAVILPMLFDYYPIGIIELRGKLISEENKNEIEEIIDFLLLTASISRILSQHFANNYSRDLGILEYRYLRRVLENYASLPTNPRFTEKNNKRIYATLIDLFPEGKGDEIELENKITEIMRNTRSFSTSNRHDGNSDGLYLTEWSGFLLLLSQCKNNDEIKKITGRIKGLNLSITLVYLDVIKFFEKEKEKRILVNGENPSKTPKNLVNELMNALYVDLTLARD